MKIAILGAEGSFTEEAANYHCQRNDIKPAFLHCETPEEVFKSVDDKTAKLGVIPISNSLGGGVEETITAMSQHSFRPIAFFEIRVRQNLLTRQDTKPANITKIVSHPQAFAQCRLYLARNWLKAKKVPYNSTASAARDLATGALDNDVAVIASSKAAKLYGLKTVASDIQDFQSNFTQFLVFSRR